MGMLIYQIHNSGLGLTEVNEPEYFIGLRYQRIKIEIEEIFFSDGMTVKEIDQLFFHKQ